MAPNTGSFLMPPYQDDWGATYGEAVFFFRLWWSPTSFADSPRFAASDPCDVRRCNQGSCFRGACNCSATDGWTGLLCEVSPCQAAECGLHSRCIAGVCQCRDGWSGRKCLTPPSCEPLACRHGVLGSARGSSDNCKCTCDGHWAGQSCERCARPCLNGGTAREDCAGCQCPPGFAGQFCEERYLGLVFAPVRQQTFPVDALSSGDRERFQIAWCDDVRYVYRSLGFAISHRQLVLKVLTSIEIVVWLFATPLADRLLGASASAANSSAAAGDAPVDLSTAFGLLGAAIADTSSAWHRGTVTGAANVTVAVLAVQRPKNLVLDPAHALTTPGLVIIGIFASVLMVAVMLGVRNLVCPPEAPPKQKQAQGEAVAAGAVAPDAGAVGEADEPEVLVDAHGEFAPAGYVMDRRLSVFSPRHQIPGNEPQVELYDVGLSARRLTVDMSRYMQGDSKYNDQGQPATAPSTATATAAAAERVRSFDGIAAERDLRDLV